MRRGWPGGRRRHWRRRRAASSLARSSTVGRRASIRTGSEGEPFGAPTMVRAALRFTLSSLSLLAFARNGNQTPARRGPRELRMLGRGGGGCRGLHPSWNLRGPGYRRGGTSVGVYRGSLSVGVSRWVSIGGWASIGGWLITEVHSRVEGPEMGPEPVSGSRDGSRVHAG